ncbi:isoleucine--tRNA ligase [Candidatus Berkelbacteria bacterium]|nr:isoleucine--tRNA ligase [Candidatus Berkelbacteria bacterium]
MDLVKLEQEILAFWQREKVFERSLEKRKGAKPFVFYEGPPSANAKPGIHHVLARAFKDLIPRFKAMQGFYVARRAGWDTHGLPIEVQAEKELGLKSKKDIESYGVAEFNAYCRALVFKYQREWEALTRRIGFWIDLEHPYVTYENGYIEKLWGIVKQFHDKKLLYKSHKVVPHCPRCGTSLSSHEVAQGYEDITEPSVYAKFKILDGPYKDRYMIAWTTTPWTLPGNVALAVGKQIAYAKYLLDGEQLIVAKARAKVLGLTGKGDSVAVEKLLGSHYQPLYPLLAGKSKDIHTIIDADFVSTEEGTGVVHTAVMYGEDDYKLADRFDLPKIHTVGEDGLFNDFVKPFARKFVKDADPDIIQDLEDRGLLFKKEDYTHSYPFCWRCGTPLLYYAKDSWFVKMSSLRHQLLKNNLEITWIPDHLRDGRFGEFLKEAKDWAFSRERYWGTPLPIWICENGHVKVVGSVNELPKKLDDLHRPYIDEVTLDCHQCRQIMHREPYTIDGWFDSGAMPYASGEKNASRFPADFIAEGIDQTRGWFYTLLAVSTALGDGPSYKSVISNGLVLDAKGQKMSKSKGNVIDPNDVIQKHGADALRWYFYVMNRPGDNKSFVEKDLITYKNQTLGLLWNIYTYYETYSKVKSEKLKVKNQSEKLKVLDQWITARLHQTIEEVTDNLERYEITEAARSIMVFIDDTSTWYLRRSRGRQDQEFFDTLREVLITTAKLIAPFMPLNADALYQKFEKGSVHFANWPKAGKSQNALLPQMATSRSLVSEALKVRAEQGIKVRQPLARLTINKALPEPLLELIADEINVRKVVVGKTFSLDTAITAELEQEGIAREVIRFIQDLRKRAGCRLSDTVQVFCETADTKITQAIRTHQKIIERQVNGTLTFAAVTPSDASITQNGLTLSIRRGDKTPQTN